MLLSQTKSLVRRAVGWRRYEQLARWKARARHWKRLVTGQDPWVRPRIHLPIEQHGEWYLSPVGLSAGSIVYSLGIGRDIEFDRSIISRLGCRVHAFDPTPAALAWLATQSLPAGFEGHPYGVADFDGIAEFAPNTEPGNPSFAYLGLGTTDQQSGGGVRCEVHRLGTLMAMLGHSRIDLLKMDIEGAEYEVIADLLRSQIAVDQLLVEFHHRKPWIGRRRTVEAIRLLRASGYELFHISAAGEEFAFRRRDSERRP